MADIREAAETLASHDIKFEHECYDVGHLYNLKHCMDIGLFKAPVFLQFVMGILGGIGADIDNLIFMKRTADRLFGDNYRWSVLGAGGAQMPLGDHGQPDGRKCAGRGWKTASIYHAANWPKTMRNRSQRSGGSSRIWAVKLPHQTKRGTFLR